MLRILLCVPASNLNIIPEIRELTSSHSVVVLNGAVSANDLYQQAKKEFDIIHLGGHGGPQGFQLSPTEIITATDIAQLCRMTKCKLLYINACQMGQVAGYISRHGGARNPAPRYIIYSQLELPDREAWQAPLAFYAGLKDETTNAIKESAIIAAYQTADGDGIRYNLLVATTFLEQILNEIELLRKQYHNIEITTQQLFGLAGITSGIVLAIIIAYLLLR